MLANCPPDCGRGIDIKVLVGAFSAQLGPPSASASICRIPFSRVGLAECLHGEIMVLAAFYVSRPPLLSRLWRFPTPAPCCFRSCARVCIAMRSVLVMPCRALRSPLPLPRTSLPDLQSLCSQQAQNLQVSGRADIFSPPLSARLR